MSSIVLLVALQATISAPLPVQLSPRAASSEVFLATDTAVVEENRLGLRLISGYNPIDTGNEDDLSLVYSNLSAFGSLSDEMLWGAFIGSNLVIGDPLTVAPEQLGGSFTYAPSWAKFGPVTSAFVLGARLAATTQNETTGSGALGKGGGGGFGALVAEADLGSLLSVGVEAGLGADYVRLGAVRGSRTEVPVHASAGVAVKPLDFLSVNLEAATRGDTSRSNSVWEVLGLAGIQYKATELIRVQAAATWNRDRGGQDSWGFVVGIASALSLGDVDGDGLPDDEDACPAVSGSPEYQGCKFEDADGDGVWDRLDACPEEIGVETNVGCPVKDTDGDGKPDVDDPCPDSVPCSVTADS